jgi:mannose-6-phosphate isomerase-like protein (cupin superfamily)
MIVRRVGEVPRNERGAGQVSHLLLGLPGERAAMSVTWVEAEPGSQQPAHVHPDSTQVYVIVHGAGRMTVDDEERDVTAGTMICIPRGARHMIRNNGSGPLIYVSATAPPFPVEVDEATWQPA